MRIAMALEGPRYTPAMADARPLGGTETGFAMLARAFARRGHEVTAYAGPDPELIEEGVRWRPLGASPPERADLVIAARVPRLFGALPRRGRRALWLFNPCGYLTKPRNLWPLLKARPVAVTLGRYHDGTLPRWMPVSGRMQLPLCVSAPVRREDNGAGYGVSGI